MKWLSSLFEGKAMAALSAGTKAPEFELAAMDGSKFSLQDALNQGPVLAVFFKISCPVCQYALPFYERIYKANGSGNVSIVGISQNEKRDTAEFAKRYGITFPILLDDTKTFLVSNAYGLTNVPTSFWIGQDGEIEVSSVGWVKSDFEEIGRKMAEAGKTPPAALFKPGEEVRDFRPG